MRATHVAVCAPEIAFTRDVARAILWRKFPRRSRRRHGASAKGGCAHGVAKV